MRNYAAEHATRAASTQRVRRNVRAGEKRQWLETTMQSTAKELEETGRKANPAHFTEMSTSRGIGMIQRLLAGEKL